MGDYPEGWDYNRDSISRSDCGCGATVALSLRFLFAGIFTGRGARGGEVHQTPNTSALALNRLWKSPLPTSRRNSWCLFRALAVPTRFSQVHTPPPWTLEKKLWVSVDGGKKKVLKNRLPWRETIWVEKKAVGWRRVQTWVEKKLFGYRSVYVVLFLVVSVHSLRALGYYNSSVRGYSSRPVFASPVTRHILEKQLYNYCVLTNSVEGFIPKVPRRVNEGPKATAERFDQEIDWDSSGVLPHTAGTLKCLFFFFFFSFFFI